MKAAILMVSLLQLIALSAHAGQEGNGGDICEDRFKIVRDDLNTWILAGGGSGLSLPGGLTLDQYDLGMINEISKASVSCTDERITVGGADKTCKNWVDAGGAPLILCNRSDFLATAQEDQYVLVHHEYAGLAGFETSDGSDSQYPISNQISGFLADQTVKKLLVKQSPPPSNDPFDPGSCSGPQISFAEAAVQFQAGATQVSLADFVIQKRSRPCNAVTGCGAWGPTQTKLGNSLGSLTHDLEMRGTLNLKVEGNDIDVYVGAYPVKLPVVGAMCSSVTRTQACSQFNFLIGTQWVNGPYPTYSYVLKADNKPMKLSGLLTDSCIRLTDSAKTSTEEEQYVLLARFGNAH